MNTSEKKMALVIVYPLIHDMRDKLINELKSSNFTVVDVSYLIPLYKKFCPSFAFYKNCEHGCLTDHVRFYANKLDECLSILSKYDFDITNVNDCICISSIVRNNNIRVMGEIETEKPSIDLTDCPLNYLRQYKNICLNQLYEE